MKFNYLDVIILLPFIWAIYRGWKKGFIIQLATLVAMILGFWGAQALSDITVPYLKTHHDVTSPYTRVTVFAIYLVVLFLVVYLIGVVLTKVVKAAALGIPNRLAGVLFSVAKYSILICFAVFYCNKLNNSFNFMDPTLPDGSMLFSPLLKLSNWLYANLTI